MKRAISFAAAVMVLSLTGCADMQKQASGYLPSSSSQQPAQVAVEGGQPVQYIPGTGTGKSVTTTRAGTSYQANANTEESSFMGDMVKTATDSLKSEATSGVRSTVRGLFSR